MQVRGISRHNVASQDTIFLASAMKTSISIFRLIRLFCIVSTRLFSRPSLLFILQQTELKCRKDILSVFSEIVYKDEISNGEMQSLLHASFYVLRTMLGPEFNNFITRFLYIRTFIQVQGVFISGQFDFTLLLLTLISH